MNLWRLTNYGANATTPAIAGDFANPAGDGIVNLVKHALQMAPNATATFPAVTIANGYLTLSFPVNPAAADVTFTSQSGHVTGRWSSASVTVLVNTSTHYKFRDNGSLGSRGPR